MWSEGEKCQELILLDGSNYKSWSNSFLHNLNAFNPSLLSIVHASICPPNINWSDFSKVEGKCLQLNAQAINLLTQSLCPNVEALILEEYGFPEDAHLLWKSVKEKFSEITVAQDSRSVDCLTKPVRPVWLRQLPQSFKEGSAIDEMESQLLKQALCLLQVMGSALWLKTRKRRRLRVKKKKMMMNMILILIS
jgi:hypothetical protein